MAEEKSVDTAKQKILILSDGPASLLKDDNGKEVPDPLGFSIFKNVIARIVEDTTQDHSLCIGLYGDYGSGKTTVLRWIHDETKEIEDVIPIWFNPWRYTREKHLIIPFFHTMAATLREYEKNDHPIAKKAAKFFRTAAKVPFALVYGMEPELSIPWFAKLKLDVAKAMDRGEKEAKATEDKEKAETTKILEDYHSIYYRLIEEIKESKGEEIKIVVCIDDLDRCLPEKAVELLEGIKVFLDFPGFFFVIGMDERVIQKGIRVRYRDFITKEGEELPVDPGEYLEKIIQLPLRLPKPESTRMLDMIKKQSEDNPALHKYCELIAEVMERKPRSCKRLVNMLSVNLALADERKSGEPNFQYKPDLLAKWTMVQSVANERLIYYIVKIPILLYKIQEAVSAKGKDDKKDALYETLDEFERSIPGIREESIKTILRKNENGEMANFTDDELEIRNIIELASASRKEPEATLKSSLKVPFKRGAMANIPAGEFWMGSEKGYDDEKPVHKISTDAYEMGVFPVTNSEFAEFIIDYNDYFKKVCRQEEFLKNWKKGRVDDAGSWIPPEGKERHPVVCVNWEDAKAYCQWRSEKENKKYHLPSEAQWERAAKGDKDQREYPWGEDFDAERCNCNESGIGNTSEVGFYPLGKSPHGCHDMSGNVWEWCEDDWHDSYEKAPNDGSARIDKTRSSLRVVRGGSWTTIPYNVRASNRNRDVPDDRDYNLGFRLSRD